MYGLTPFLSPCAASSGKKGNGRKRKERLLGSFLLLLWELACLRAAYSGAVAPKAWGSEKLKFEIDINSEVSPISPYIYGQFIEHMGRSIYGGIWAEMLEDRKFFHPVGGSKMPKSGRSPWSAFGTEEGGSVLMDREEKYVGEWSVRISSEKGKEVGIRHKKLRFLGGKSYVGYVIAKASEPVAGLWVGIEFDRQGIKKRLELERSWKKIAFSFKVPPQKNSTDPVLGSFRISAKGSTVWIGAVSLMPADNVQGFRRDTLRCLRLLAAPIYRWPGGNFVSGYDWRIGIGDRDKRPPFKNPAWPGFDQNDFGIDEFMTFVRLVGAEPYVVVNAGLGTVEMAKALIEYTNGSVNTRWGKLRAKNGHPEPYNIRWWGIGNEMYGKWQLGHVPLDQYIKRHRAFAKAMRSVDPNIRIIAVGRSGAWSRRMLEEASDTMTLLSEHFYCPTHSDVIEHVKSMREAVRKKAELHRKVCKEVFGTSILKVPVALDEWNYYWGEKPHVYGPYGVPYTWKDGLGVAAALCEIIRNRRVFYMANFAQAVNVIGALKTTELSAALETSALPLMLFRHQFGGIGVAVKGRDEVLDLVASLTKDRRYLTIAVVNPSYRWRSLEVSLSGTTLNGKGKVFLISHTNPEEGNCPAFVSLKGASPGKVRVEVLPFLGVDLKAFPAPPLSVVLWKLGLGEGEMPEGVFRYLRKPAKGEILLCVYKAGNALRASLSSDGGKTWERKKDLIPEIPKKLKPLQGFSLFRSPEGPSLVICSEAGIVTYRIGPKLSLSGPFPLKLGGAEGELFTDPQILRGKDPKRFLLLATSSRGQRKEIVSLESNDLRHFSSPCLALQMKHNLRSGPLLEGALNVLFFYDGRVRTYRAALSREPDGPYVIASPPLGHWNSLSAAAYVASEGVLLFLREEDKSWRILKTGDLVTWKECPRGPVALPEKEAERVSFLWVGSEFK